MTDFVKMVCDEIKECSTADDIFSLTKIIYGLRQFDGIKQHCIPMWRKKARNLAPWWEKCVVAAVDLNQIYHAAFSVQQDDASQLCIKMLRNVYRDLQPTIFSVAVDCRRGVAKKYANSSYKNKRMEKPNSYYEQLNATIDTLQASISIEEHDGMEADDCLASTAFQCALLGSQCVLVGNDKDLWQSLYSGVSMYDRKTKEYRNAEWLLAHHKIKPKQVTDWLCMVGGKNDLPGVKGIGEARASELLEAHGDFIGAMDASQNGEMKSFFREHYWSIRDLHTLSVSVPVRWFNGVRSNK